MSDVETTMKVLRDELSADMGWRISWKANIAMAFVDEVFRHQKETGRRHISRQEFHKIANTAADNFLKLLTK